MDGCISVLVRLFFNWSMSIYSKYKLFNLQQSLYTVVHLLQFLNGVICSLITLFFKCIKLHQILLQFSTVNLAQVLDINILRRDYSHLNNPISSTYTRFIVENRDNIWWNKKEGLFWHYIFLKNILPRIFFNLVPKESFAPKCTFSIKFRSWKLRSSEVCEIELT